MGRIDCADPATCQAIIEAQQQALQEFVFASAVIVIIAVSALLFKESYHWWRSNHG